MSLKKTYFASDFHLGSPTYEKSRQREALVVNWLNEVAKDAQAIYLVGDIFDFWFEYKNTIPKGHIRFIGKIAELVDKGIEIHMFTGNHDMWMFDYFEKELGIKIIREPINKEINGKKFHIGHGDGLGPGDYSYKFIKKFFSSKICQWFFKRVHPNLGVSVANAWSNRSREKEGELVFLGPEKEWLIQYCKEILEKKHFDFFIFGHRHIPIDYDFPNGAKYINLGDWINHFTYAELDGESLNLKKYNRTN